ncbi:hypothetical protein ABB37_01990 [Leptomonas pyrrhocoris]|uniref:Uncharacterized protein n=1 Tax=Leptomonas pyrrhocoris TaxID=157538 RepID=A0A0M9G778_LEPPY|nr:hypothetical protein ABB37_01990 [Leptomonas pyrrhocoris]XP_015662194.1 hypothetical protein ABB37_01990 [Leptomonas pyrrhocoris]XP_015662195.1 hypothetical protein ABB37_01990 [Leptomonas pyrrhocoris]XP_015662196.1 hypothetical protein ABB37_01990 [Leptomonas pyrrhocoris]KPA83754.1 hypothetical protein ABB37_01990 [Leptomonas pyrrhocoris]KPA83755.1 hypothetical protein ABB37_01990 [Leptomonas pyrrhocoris]KPA83756.1 hypothetical protein ABB37_01990 [Leptomonas pyrrhocoris]KPA83757.1 hypot|eukprot:XP_015662193.1 hypothetical protein ABB37_01990 [Leptomonas pyrrhocoris]
MASYSHDDSADRYITVMSSVTGKPKRRRVVNCAAPEEDAEVKTYYANDAKMNNPLRYTTCMSHHIMARIEDDVKRAKMRQENPESVIPSKGYDYDVEASRAVEEYRATQQLPRGANVVVATLYAPIHAVVHLPAISPRSNRSRRSSNSRQPSHGPSTANSPTDQSRRVEQPSSARRPAPTSRASSKALQYPSAYRSRSAPRYNYHGSHAGGASNSSSPLPPRPAGGRLQPLEYAALGPTSGSPYGDFRDDGRVLQPANDRRSSNASRNLFLQLSSFESEEADTAVDEERQRRLRLADELAQEMDAEEM